MKHYKHEKRGDPRDRWVNEKLRKMGREREGERESEREKRKKEESNNMDIPGIQKYKHTKS